MEHTDSAATEVPNIGASRFVLKAAAAVERTRFQEAQKELVVGMSERSPWAVVASTETLASGGEHHSTRVVDTGSESVSLEVVVPISRQDAKAVR